jgi:hypothetical protein
MAGDVESALTAVILIANGVLGISFIAALRGTGAPFVPTARRKVQAIFSKGGLLAKALASRPGARAKHLVDLGSGEGMIVRAAAREGVFERATGYEINPALVAIARLQSLGAGQRERHLCTSMWHADLSDADVVMVYGVPPIMARLASKLRDELPAHALVVSNAYKFDCLGPPLFVEYIRTPAWSPDGSGPVYVYACGDRSCS